MKALFLNIAGVLLIILGVLLCIFCYMISGPEVVGMSGSTDGSAYLISFIPIALGILLFILARIVKKKSISNKEP